MYKLIIAGSRTFDDYGRLDYEVKHFIVNKIKSKNVTIISGTASGADRLGERFAEKYNLELIKMPANWDEYGKRAGHIRNEEMAKIATHCIVFIRNNSKGSVNMIQHCKKHNLIYKVIAIT